MIDRTREDIVQDNRLSEIEKKLGMLDTHESRLTAIEKDIAELKAPLPEGSVEKWSEIQIVKFLNELKDAHRRLKGILIP